MLARRSAPRRARAGFTLIELLVVIAIIATLASLILPAVNSARATARRTQCMSQMRNCGLAILQYATAKDGEMPKLLDSGFQINWGLAGTPNLAWSPWTVQILPYLEQSVLQERLQGSTNDVPSDINSTSSLAGTSMKVFNCPDDPNSELAGNLSYVVNAGYMTADMWGFDSTQHATTLYDLGFNGNAVNADDANAAHATGLFWPDRGVKTDQVNRADGSNYTIMLSENLQAETWAGRAPTAPGDFEYSGLSFSLPVTGSVGSGGSPNVVSDYSVAGGVGLAGTLAAPQKQQALQLSATFSGEVASDPNLARGRINANVNSATEGTYPRPSSLHPQVVNVFFVGGNGEPISNQIDIKVYYQLMSWNGGRHGQDIVGDSSF